MGVMSPVGKDAATGGGGQTVVRLVLQGSDSGDPAVCIRVLGDVGSDDKDGGEKPCGITT